VIVIQQTILAAIIAAILGSVGGWSLAIWLMRTQKPQAQSEPQLEPGDTVEVIQSLEWLYGPSVSVPVGAAIVLHRRYETSSGPRWAASFGEVWLHSVPEDSIKVLERRAHATDTTRLD
jgi:hypothetical protein